ncbi:unnamed protein product [Urochloa decumbens]|uniref:cysteine dioxygenase n=1 Tax=Urochloa decumbens TaxID=240449 RepID=A0ABC8Y4K4_9POAL
MAQKRLIDKCHYLFDGTNNVPPTADVVSIICGMIDKVGPDDVALMDDVRLSNEINNAAGCQEPPIITFKTIYECENFTITVFLLPQGAAMPLHDHPGMTVFSKLLIGSAHVVSYDWVHPRICTAATGSVSGAMLAQKVLDNEFTAASGAWVLFPDAGGNLHRFVTGEDGPCALLDVMTPSYSPTSETQERFAFYKDIPYELHPTTDVVNDGEMTQEQKCRLVWLQEIDEPEDLKFSNLPYQGPPVV